MVGARHPRARVNTSSYGMNACMLARSARGGADAQVCMIRSDTAVANTVCTHNNVTHCCSLEIFIQLYSRSKFRSTKFSTSVYTL